ncbi:PucR family transcriptional regulator [Anaerocolumna chitinilytica]|uniref:Transcriptional regulator n=1 Tax=Anaerocolumna chitinilytica TaxID=1727145 RepID=A0A7I8DFL5_9FIRM|nr:PucR family transcriptional regulator [Anaerocolumna chitinilytica]BCJ97313.1 transcriptional regulator [Anaerocolumna chitinilytica]
MAIAVSKLYRNCASLYQMQLLAGHKGLGNLVEWVHIVEDQEVSSFLHGHELIFIAGYMCHNNEWLLNFTKELYKSDTSAFVINLGPYIKSVPKEVVDFCNEVDMPLFTIPWKIRLVDVTRDFCTRIMHNESVEASVASTLKDIIFKVGDPETQIQHMERNGYKRDCHLCFVNISLNNEDVNYSTENMEKLKLFVEQIARTSQRMFISFTYQSNLIVVLSESDMYNVRKFVDDLVSLIRKKTDKFTVNIGVSSIMQGFLNQDINFENAVSSNEMAQKRKVRTAYYDELDIYKVLLAVKDKKILRNFYQEVFGKLEQYDMENGSDLMGFLHAYLENNGSPRLVSEEQFIHRNTVNNQIKKIEKITGYNILNLEEKVRFSIGFMIQDII